LAKARRAFVGALLLVRGVARLRELAGLEEQSLIAQD
jgi:hypothetical protein